jgi:hypothetical protein
MVLFPVHHVFGRKSIEKNLFFVAGGISWKNPIRFIKTLLPDQHTILQLRIFCADAASETKKIK